MSRALAIFKRHQRFQGGTEKVQPNTDPVPPWLRAGYDPNAPGVDEWVSPSGMRKRASAKEASGLYAPQEVPPDDEQGHDLTEEQQRAFEKRQRAFTAFNEENMSELEKARESTFSTIGMNIGDREWEVPTTWDEMPEGVMWWVHNQPQDQWPQWVTDAIENNARDLLEQGIHPLTGYKVDDPRNTPDPEEARKRAMNEYGKGTDEVQARQAVDPSAYQGQKLWDQLIRSFERHPVEQRKGPQFSPKDVPIVPMDDAGNLGYDPELSSTDEYLLAQNGTSHAIPWPAQVDELMERLFFREKREPYPRDRNKFNPRDVPLMDTDTGRAFNPSALGNMNWAQKGTSNVNNPGLRLFYQTKMLRKKKP